MHAWHLGRMAGVELLFFESDVDRRAQFESVHRAKSVQSLEELLADCDVIDLCLPTDLHEEYAMRTLQAGKPTFIEKPVADCVAAGRRIAEAAKAHGARVGVGQVVRYFPEFREARAAVKQGKIGTPAAARTRRGGAMPTRAWFGDHSRSGGVRSSTLPFTTSTGCAGLWERLGKFSPNRLALKLWKDPTML